MREGMLGGISPESAGTPKPPENRFRALNPEFESQMRTREPFAIGGVSVDQLPPPKEKPPEYCTLTKAMLMSFVAHGGLMFAIEGTDIVRTETQVTETAEAHKTPDILKELQKETEHNETIREQLKTERTETIDHLINEYLDPSSPEYQKELSVGADAFITLDAQNFGVAYADRAPGSLPSVEQIHEQTKEYQDELKAQYEFRVEKLISNRAYTWTGNLEEDLSTLRTAMYEGNDRFFSSDYYDTIQYQKDSWRTADELSTGIVNCQSSRFTPILLEEVYEAHKLDQTPLKELKAAVWKDHIETGILRPDGTTGTFMEMQLGRPIDTGSNSPFTGEAATFLPIDAHLALYLTESGATGEQTDRLKALGLLPKTETKFLEWNLPNGVMSLGHFTSEPQELLMAPGEFSEEQNRDLANVHGKAARQLDEYLKHEAMTTLSAGAGGSNYFVEIPQWTSNHALREYIVDSFYTKEATEQKYILESIKLWGINHPKEAEELVKQMIEENTKEAFIQAPANELYAYQQLGLSELITPIINNPQFSADYMLDSTSNAQRVIYRSLATEYQLPQKVLDTLSKFDAETDKNSLDNELRFRLLTKEEIANMPSAQLLEIIDEGIVGNTPELYLQDGRAAALLERSQHDPEIYFRLERRGFLISPQLKERSNEVLEQILANGQGGDWTQGSTSMEGEEYVDYSTVAKKYPHIYKTYTERTLRSHSELWLHYSGIYKDAYGQPFSRELTWSDFESNTRENLPVTNNPEVNKEIIRFYLNATDHNDRMWLLENLVSATKEKNLIIPKSSLYPEDLAAMKDYQRTPALTRAYATEAITTASMQGYIEHGVLYQFQPDIGLVLERNFNEGARLFQEINSLPDGEIPAPVPLKE